MANLYDVAALAGVSKTLVSRVINNQSGVSEKSRKKIQKAILELGYAPNAIARSLVLQKTNVIGVVLDSLCEPYFFDFITGIEKTIAKSNYDVLFCSCNEDVSVKERKIRLFSEGRADGVIIYGSNFSDIDLIKNMALNTFPFVVVENEADFSDVNSIVVDNIHGGQLAVEHLVGLGCRNIWHFTGDMKRTVSISRRDGYINAMTKHRLTPKIIESEFEEKTGYLQMKQLIQINRGNLPDGIFFSGDITAFGALAALVEEGIAVPDTIKIVGFDNDSRRNNGVQIPELTTLSQPLFDMGATSVNMLLENIVSPKSEKKTMRFYPELIVRESTVK